jgi:hypothetical protein
MAAITLNIVTIGGQPASFDPMNPTVVTGTGDVPVAGNVSPSQGYAISTLERVEGCFDPPKAISMASLPTWTYNIAKDSLLVGVTFTVWVEARDNDSINPGFQMQVAYVQRASSDATHAGPKK